MEPYVVVLAELLPRLLHLVDALVEAVDVVGVAEQSLGSEAGATAHVEDAVALLDVEHLQRLVAHLLVPDERVHPVVHLREVLVEQAGPRFVFEDSHRAEIRTRR